MSFAKRILYFLVLNILIVTTASIVGGIIVKAFGIQGEWGFYIVFYSLIGFGGAFVSLALSRYFAKKFMGVRVISLEQARGREKDLVETVHRLSDQARLPEKPEVGIYESPSPNAFATGPSKKKSLVAVSRGLLDRMNERELEGVLAHEVAHIANGDMVTMTLLQGLINTMVLLAARFVAKIIVSKMKSRSFWMEFMIFTALQIAFSILGSVVLCWFSRAREFRADAGGARLAGKESMISALQALERLTGLSGAQPEFTTARGPGGAQSQSYNYLQISGRKAKASWFSTHPPLSARIARLEKSRL